MENEEKYINDISGRQNPFRVPDGYFDEFTARLMEQIPKDGGQAKTLSLRSWLYAAACIAVAVVMGLTYYFQQPMEAQPSVASTETNTDNTYIDEVADYAMIDNAEIYACLADN